MTRVRIATAAGDLDKEALLSATLAVRSDVHLVLRCVDRVELLAAIRGGQLEALILLGNPEWLDRQCVSEARARSVKILAVTDGDAPMGASHVVGSDASADEIVAACVSAPIESVGGSQDFHEDAQPPGRLTSVWGPKGSPGRSRISIELAFAVQRDHVGAALIDADPYGGDLIQLLGMAEEIPSLVWAVRAAAKGELDSRAIERNLRAHPLGPVVLPGLPRADLWADVSEFGFGEMIDIFRSTFAHTICDVGFCLEPAAGTALLEEGGRNRMARLAIQRSDHVVAVCRADPSGIKHFMWAFQEVTRLVDPERITIVANRVRPGDERELSALFERHLKKRPSAYVPDRSELLAEAVRSSRPVRGLRSESEYRAAIDAVAVAIGARLRPRGFLTRLGGRR